MRMLKTFAIAAVVLALAAPAMAKCTAPYAISTVSPDGTSHIWTDGWAVIYYAPGIPPLTAAYGEPPVTPEFFGVFWELGAGDTTLGLGNDAGGFTQPPAAWAYNYMFYYVYPTADIMFTTWAASTAIDGCPTIGSCQCLLMTDQRDGVGYFAMASGASNAGGDVYLNQAGTDEIGWASPVKLMEMPAPVITRVDLDQATNIATFNVTTAAPTAGVYTKDACNCGPLGYVLYQQVKDHGTAAPGDRNAASGWTAISGTLPMGTPYSYDTTVCQALDVDVYLAAGMVFDSGFPGGPYKVILSRNAEPLRCGTNLAEPQPLQPRIRRQLRDLPRGERIR